MTRPKICVLLGAAVLTGRAFPCSIMGPISNVRLVNDADAIVLAKAMEYSVPPANTALITTGVPDSTVRFKVIESLRGGITSDLILPGYLSDTDDFNEQPAPYTFVRRNGRHGSCFANTYRDGGQFLLFLKKTSTGGQTVNWYALAPVNEQIHPVSDPWLNWVRAEIDKAKAISRPKP
jgi:hypothetical protein